jgi:DNA polymerase zeta
MDVFRVRLNCVDHYQAVPHDAFDPPVPRSALNENVKERPRISVIRVFGATETGQKVLMHVHGALQYTYIEYSGSLVPEDVEVAIRTLQLSIDHALAVSYRKNPYEETHRYVAHITLVKGVPFYGYHVGYKFYLKIYLLNPSQMNRLADLLRDGAVMKRVLQPYESHMQYIAQWMCDYNLYGCGYIECGNGQFRAPVPAYADLDNSQHQWHDRSILPENISDEFLMPKQSHCSLELDIHVRDILNRQNLEARPIHHDFVERIAPLARDAKLVQSMAGLWKDETRRRKVRMGIKDPNSSPFPPEVLVTMSADPRNTSAGGWIHEEEYRQKIAKIAEDESRRSENGRLTFDTFVKQAHLETRVQTALESVEDLYPGKLQSRQDGVLSNGGGNLPEGSQAVVDEDKIRGLAHEDRSSSEDAFPSHPNVIPDSDPRNGHATPGSSGELIKSPISSSEYAKYGIIKAGDTLDTSKNALEIPAAYMADAVQSSRQKREVPDVSVTRSRKRRRLLVNRDDVLPEFDWHDDDIDSFNDSGIEDGPAETFQPAQAVDDEEEQVLEVNKPSPFVANAPKIGDQVSALRSTQSSKLPFPVVKNPSDPNTVLRLSQASSQSQKLSQEPDPDSNENYRTLAKTPQKSTMGSIIKTPTTTASTRAMEKSDPIPPIFLRLSGIFPLKEGNSVLVARTPAPSFQAVAATLWTEGLPDVIYQEAYYSNEKDIPDQAREYAGREFKLESATVPYLPDFDANGTSAASYGRKQQILVDQRRKRCTLRHWSIADAPPRWDEVKSWLDDESAIASTCAKSKGHGQSTKHSQIEGPTQKNTYGFKYSSKQDSTSVQHETQYMSIMCLEVHVNTRGSLAPNPDEDPVSCIFWCIKTDDEDIEEGADENGIHMGILAMSDAPGMAKKIGRNVSIEAEQEHTELDLLTRLVDIVRFYDPDILTGYEVHNSSWGYLIERARIKYDLNYCDEISRMKSQSHGRFGKAEDRWGFNHTSTIRVTGRHTINIWRAMRGELNLLQYTMENVAFHLLHRRLPHYSFADLTKWYKSKNPREHAKVIEYFTSRVRVDLEILEANELVPRTSEQARLLGVDWFSVISRGSQFKVESLMFRIAKPENLILVSPSRRQVGGQNALECLPLVMEPQSDFYASPLLVLDFQSLYPSVMIAYNYCYSTFLGRVVSWRGTNKMGFTDYRREPGLIELLKDHINIAPNGIMYAKTEIRKSLLAKMLSEILETRVMVKSGMKVDKDDKTLQTLLNNRQLALKLIANVTYGYTSASFSGRMPCSEIADSIVQTGRETLEKAIALIHSVERWGAEVVYGDTDSLFVYLKGRTRDQAFDIGGDIARTITKMNPQPVKLKFEKVYHPCVLLAKKRYVGFKYESRDQVIPEFDAKGIETVRRDGTPAEQKIEENALKVLFRTADLSQVKSYFQEQCSKIMRGKVSIQDFCFAREVKLGSYSDKGPPPPGALISARKMLEDPRLEPQYGERIPYVVVTGGPGARLIDRCVAPEVLLNDAQSELDAEYYISKNLIPPLERIFNLVGANVRQWYDEMPKYQRIRRIEAEELGITKKTLESYMKSSTCVVCREGLDTEGSICNSCKDQASQSLLNLRARLIRGERKKAQMTAVCRSCEGGGWTEQVRCESKDCPIFYSRTRHKAAQANDEAQLGPVIRMLEEKEGSGLSW